jgi:hypothetical protein
MVEELLEKIPNDTFSSSEIDLSGNYSIDDILSDLDMRETQDSLNPIDIININGIASLHMNIFAAKIPFKAGELHLKIAKIISIGFKLSCVSRMPNSDQLTSTMDDRNDESGMIQKMSVDCPSDIITFIRLGRPSISKSKLINTMLSDTSHETFFNKNCPLGCIS